MIAQHAEGRLVFFEAGVGGGSKNWRPSCWAQQATVLLWLNRHHSNIPRAILLPLQGNRLQKNLREPVYVTSRPPVYSRNLQGWQQVSWPKNFSWIIMSKIQNLNWYARRLLLQNPFAWPSIGGFRARLVNYPKIKTQNNTFRRVSRDFTAQIHMSIVQIAPETP